MRERPKIILFVIAIGIVHSTFVCAQNRTTQNTSGLITNPSSQITGDLYDISSNKELDTNQIVTGNVRNGMSFKGNIPYKSTNSFYGKMGTSAFSSYIRDSAGSQDIDSYRTTSLTSTPYQSFYMPSQTVTDVVQNKTGTHEVYTLSDYGNDNSKVLRDTLQMPSSWELHDIGNTTQQTSKDSTKNSFNTQNIQPPSGQSLRKTADKIPESETQNINSADESDKQAGTNSDLVIARLQKQIDDLTKSIEERYTSDADIHKTPSELPKTPAQSYLDELKTPVRVLPSKNPKENAVQSPANDKTVPVESLSRISLKVVDTNRYNEAAEKDKFDVHFQNGLTYLKAGRFKKASESFTIAAIYHPNDYKVFANQAHCLFADGQYINSALFLIRALDLYPEYINQQIVMADEIGGMEQLLKNRSELEQLVELSNASGLQLLLSYVYYRTGNLNEARKITNALEPQIPDSTAFMAVKLAVESALSRNNKSTN
jgi:tetratricopeptide (TPR) repeat protein